MNAQIAGFLRRIPASNEPAVPLNTLVPDTEADLMRGFLSALHLWGIVTSEGDSVRASSQTALYTLHSLAEWLESEEVIIRDWHTRGLHAEPLFNGATFLSYLEKERVQRLADPQPSRIERVAQVLIKRTNPTTSEPELLFQFDRNAQRYQLIGGRYSPRDHDNLHTTIIREITEELAPSALIPDQDYTLSATVHTIHIPPLISPTFGALSAYTFTIFHMQNLRKPLILSVEDRWIAVKDVLANYLPDAPDKTLFAANNTLYDRINTVTGGLATLPDSIRDQP